SGSGAAFAPIPCDRYRLAGLRRPKLLYRHAALLERLRQFPNRLVHSLRRQLKRAVMHRETAARAEIEVRLHGFGRIHVNVFHEPARLVGADGKERQSDWGEPRGDLPEMRPTYAISREQESAPAGPDHVSLPPGRSSIEL